MNNCKNCNKELIGEFCSKCGFPKKLKRIDKSYIIDEISSVINFDKGFFYTVKKLFIRPGDTIREFILEDRKRLVKPIFFLIICSVIHTVMRQFLTFEVENINLDFDNRNESVIENIVNWFSNNLGYANILIAIFIAFWLKIFFKNYNYNFYEIYILLCFTMGITMLIYTFWGIMEAIFNYSLSGFETNIGILYSAWAIGQFFDRKKKLNYLKGLFCYMLGMFTFGGILNLIEIIFKN